jgi:hypothetical protein
MNDKPKLLGLEAGLRAARQRVTDAADAVPPVGAEQLLGLREGAYRAWVELEKAKGRRCLP